SERLGKLRRDERLDQVAQAHAEAMLKARRIGHDVGNGDPRARVEAAGLALNAAGENVVHAANLRRAHRALWSSPSHRGNLLQKRFDALGIGITNDPDGSVWVCEVFGDSR
ncbi:MAG TPA: CAP domain-containing protein, partial [Polyangiaceae bacterium]|nr:CAP domain-containing protein [Polyangiaceae bacterium]